jgi:hypothetical protein
VNDKWLGRRLRPANLSIDVSGEAGSRETTRLSVLESRETSAVEDGSGCLEVSIEMELLWRRGKCPVKQVGDKVVGLCT